MENGLGMNQELRQRQRLTSYQYRALHILQLGNAQVGELLKKEYMENPFIEQREGFSPEESRWLEYYKSGTAGITAPLYGAGPLYKAGETEYGHSFRDWRMDIKEQLYDGLIPADQCRIMELMIRMLDDRGFLPFTDQEGGELMNIPAGQYLKLRSRLMELEPGGIGCSSMGEYFLYQLMKKGIAVPEQFRELCLNHLNSIPEMTYVQVGRLIHASFQEVKQWVRVLGTLEPYPVRDSQQDGHVETVVPDILIAYREGTLSVIVNDYYMRQYCVSDFYIRAAGSSEDKEVQAYMDRKLLRAKQIYQAVNGRNQTVRRMGEYLLEQQRGFFNGGFLTGMTYRMLSEKLKVHESTVSRLVANKYVSCPQGILPLRFFFSKGVEVADGQGQVTGTMGKSSVKEIISLLISGEPGSRPYSDQKLADLLKADYGLRISRRTVSNYREEAGIRSVYERKD